MIDHIGIKVSNYERSRDFYQKALVSIGYSLLMEFNFGKKIGGFGTDGKPDFWIEEDSGTPFHFAFAAKDRKTVDAFYEAALQVGGKDNGAPGLRPQYHPHYYGAFILDPDGYNVEVVCHQG